MNREVRVYGPLARFVGQRRFLAEVNSAGEAVRMLLANFPGLQRHMSDLLYFGLRHRLAFVRPGQSAQAAA